jgi:hypothetical protein
MESNNNKFEIWSGYYNYSLPNAEFVVCEFEQNEKGVKLTFSELTFSDREDLCNIQVEFNGEIAYIRDVPELKRILTTGKLYAEGMEFYKCHEFIFVVRHSSLVRELKLNPDMFTHFCLIETNSFTDIITDKDPIIRRLTDNE